MTEIRGVPEPTRVVQTLTPTNEMPTVDWLLDAAHPIDDDEQCHALEVFVHEGETTDGTPIHVFIVRLPVAAIDSDERRTIGIACTALDIRSMRETFDGVLAAYTSGAFDRDQPSSQ